MTTKNFFGGVEVAVLLADGMFGPPAGTEMKGPLSSPPPPAGPPVPAAPGPYPPVPKKGPSGCVIAAIGCGVLALLLILVTAGTCLFLGSKAQGLMPSLMQMIKSEYVNNLSTDHSEEDRARFAACYDAMVLPREEKGFFKWAAEFSDEFEKLNQISEDNEITVEESREWCGMIESATGEEISGEGGSAEEGEEGEAGEGGGREENQPLIEKGSTTERSLRKAADGKVFSPREEQGETAE